MELEVFVPVAESEVRRVLGDPGQVARSVPGLQRAADGEPLEGRLKVRIGGHTITYRGSAKVARRGGAYAIEGEAAEVRGSGSVQLALKLRLVAAEGGTTLAFSGGAKADGRAAEADEAAVDSAARRLLTRFAERLGEVAAQTTVAEPAAKDGPDAAEAPAESSTQPSAQPSAQEAGDAAEPVTGDVDEAGLPTDGPGLTEDDAPSAEATPAEATDTEATPAEATDDTPSSVFETEVPPPSLDPAYDEALAEEVDEVFGEAPTEAAHARRTMIGRSAEEVDHAPPRGRYAPMPAPAGSAATDTLRWVAPAAALAVAGAIVVSRVLRRRK
ncbi:carbon monoxide dehydrogenase [Streptomyces sp. TRM66268-LWL]|uniref:Carbon monoxide dehydrogenase n=1 Tax=Streptomyces polyasparticus TaxID=2767826 RepID=A0ABR7SGC0_9ACTN|nr:SRPBCC domain-containing protein [Streptomyces polyasparticus]MBC9714532.1 carbon monoxide dehydrogenase [Streptomyces polyasparticus]